MGLLLKNRSRGFNFFFLYIELPLLSRPFPRKEVNMLSRDSSSRFLLAVYLPYRKKGGEKRVDNKTHFSRTNI